MNKQDQKITLATQTLESVGLFLHHCWCDVSMNDYSYEKLLVETQKVDNAIQFLKENQ